jgi:cytochrome c biogenesis protein CcmG, thiol:disulfide interchange protein DsbE
VSSRKTRLTAFLCGGTIALFLAVLVFVPKYFRKTHFVLEGAPQEGNRGTFPLDQAFNLVDKSGGAKRTTLRELLRDPAGTLLVNFWATWCPPCVEELPSLEYLNRELNSEKGTGLPKLVSISVDERTEEILSLFSTLDFRPTFTVLHDPSGPFATERGTVKFPETYWVDAQGKILYKWLGPQDWLSRDVLLKLGNFGLSSR